MLAFSNQARETLSRGARAIADAFYANTRHYLDTWNLPKKPRGRANDLVKKLAAPRALFDAQEEKDLTAALLEMDASLKKIAGKYVDLEKYVKDDTIHDDGKQGQALARDIFAGHAQFMKAQDSWLAIVEKNARDAEIKLLRGHPLQAQILAAQELFAQFQQVTDLLKADDTKRETLTPLCQNLQAIIMQAGQPPFPAAPGLERLYRFFLKEAADYANVLEQGIMEGFYAPQKKELNAAAIKCQKAYNRFAAAANADSMR